jgi:hypothetical protein
VQFGLITFVKVGSRVLFIKADLDTYMEERRVVAKGKSK